MNTIPAGYSLIPPTLISGALQGEAASMPSIAIAQRPITVAEYQDAIKHDGYFVALDHNYKAGVTTFLGAGKNPEELLGGPIKIPNPSDCFGVSRGDVVFFGSRVLLKMNRRPWEPIIQQYRWGNFSKEDHPIIGVSYFHAVAWCFLMSEKMGGVRFELPSRALYSALEKSAIESSEAPSAKMKLKGSPHSALENTHGVREAIYEVEPLNFMDVSLSGNVKRFLKVEPALSLDFWRSGSTCMLAGESWRTIFSSNSLGAKRRTNLVGRSDDLGFQPVIFL